MDRRPDLGTVPTNLSIDWQRTRAPWQILRGLGEVKTIAESSKTIDIKTALRLGNAAHEISRSQHRRFVPTFSVAGSEVRFYLSHPGGIAPSEMFDLHKDPVRFLKLLWLMTCASDEHQGLDPTIKVDESPARMSRAVGDNAIINSWIKADKILVAGRWLTVKKYLWGEPSFCGRSMTMHVVEDESKEERIVKTRWCDVTRCTEERGDEAIRLERAKDVGGLCRLLQHEWLRAEDNGDSTYAICGRIDPGEGQKPQTMR